MSDVDTALAEIGSELDAIVGQPTVDITDRAFGLQQLLRQVHQRKDLTPEQVTLLAHYAERLLLEVFQLSESDLQAMRVQRATADDTARAVLAQRVRQAVNACAIELDDAALSLLTRALSDRNVRAMEGSP